MRYDVVVCGAGPSGTAAAIAASRAGAKVGLLERYGFAGGMATSALVNPFAGHHFADPSSGRVGSLIGGIFKEIAGALDAEGAYGSPLTLSTFDEQRLKLVYDRMLRAAGVDPLYHAWIIGARTSARDGGRSEADVSFRVTSVEVVTKEGRFSVEADVFVDATGDADVAAFAGCKASVGRPSDGLTQAMTTSFRIGGVAKERMQQEPGLKAARLLVEPYFQKARADGSLVFPYRDFVHFYDYPRRGVLHFNMTRINPANGLRWRDLAEAEIEGRRQSFLLADWLAREVPLFEHSYLEKVATHVGVRETRHVEGLYTVSHEDIAAGRKFPDGIARSSYFIDIHSPTGPGFDHEVPGTRGETLKTYAPPRGDWYEIPYRSIVPVACENLLVPCRALSATHEGCAAIRVMATMTAVGQAAGIAAAESARRGAPVGAIDGARVRKQLGYLDEGPDYDPLFASRGRERG